MNIDNIEITKTPVKTIDELDRGYSKHKRLHGDTNLRQITSRGKLLEEGFHVLESAYDTQKHRQRELTFDGADNKSIILDLARFAAKYPEFFLNAKMTEEFQNDIDEGYDKNTFSIFIQNGKVEVTLL
jgi:hypothetical protein